LTGPSRPFYNLRFTPSKKMLKLLLHWWARKCTPGDPRMNMWIRTLHGAFICDEIWSNVLEGDGRGEINNDF
jgi:hypothetical protein